MSAEKTVEITEAEFETLRRGLVGEESLSRVLDVLAALRKRFGRKGLAR